MQCVLGIRSIRRAFPLAGMPDGPGRRQGRARCRACFAALTPPGPARPPAPRLRHCWRAFDEPKGPPSKKAASGPRADRTRAQRPRRRRPSRQRPRLRTAPRQVRRRRPAQASTQPWAKVAVLPCFRATAATAEQSRAGCQAGAMRAFSDARPSFTRRAEQPGRRRVRAPHQPARGQGTSSRRSANAVPARGCLEAGRVVWHPHTVDCGGGRQSARKHCTLQAFLFPGRRSRPSLTDLPNQPSPESTGAHRRCGPDRYP